MVLKGGSAEANDGATVRGISQQEHAKEKERREGNGERREEKLKNRKGTFLDHC